MVSQPRQGPIPPLVGLALDVVDWATRLSSLKGKEKDIGKKLCHSAYRCTVQLKIIPGRLNRKTNIMYRLLRYILQKFIQCSYSCVNHKMTSLMRRQCTVDDWSFAYLQLGFHLTVMCSRPTVSGTDGSDVRRSRVEALCHPHTQILARISQVCYLCNDTLWLSQKQCGRLAMREHPCKTLGASKNVIGAFWPIWSDLTLTSTWPHLRCLKEGEYWKKTVCVAVLCTIIMVHRGTSSFLQVGQRYRALILLGLALSSERLCVFYLLGVVCRVT